VINYTYARTRPILERLKKSGDIDKRHGARVRYANPINGGWALPTMGAYLALFPAGFKGEPYRSTDGMIFVCAEAKARPRSATRCSSGGRTTYSSRRPGRATATTPARIGLFSISDRPMQEALGIWREDTAH
jgi:Gentisate 1,2-dioxygenase